MDEIGSFLKLLASPEHNHTRWGDDNGDRTTRLVAADLFGEAGRYGEEQLLRNLKQHIVVRRGKVYPGKFTMRHIDRAARRFIGYYQDPGDANIELGDENHLFLNDVLLGEPEGNRVRVGNGEDPSNSPYDRDLPRYEESVIHPSEAGNHVADIIEGLTPDHPNRKAQTDRIRNAPFEAIDTGYQYDPQRMSRLAKTRRRNLL